MLDKGKSRLMNSFKSQRILSDSIPESERKGLRSFTPEQRSCRARIKGTNPDPPPEAESMAKLMTAKQRRQNTLAFTLVFCLFSTMGGCALPPWRANPDWTAKAKGIRSLLIVPAEVRVYQVSLETMRLNGDWSETGRQNLDNAILEGFRNRDYRVKLLRAEGEIHREMERILPLFRAVNKSIRLHTYGPQVFPEKIAHFEYSLGSLKSILDTSHCDAMVFVRGFEQVSERPKKTYMTLALADSSGTILWYCVKGSRGEHDLRNPKSAANLVDALLSDFPEAKR
jgi:hypothetical protein